MTLYLRINGCSFVFFCRSGNSRNLSFLVVMLYPIVFVYNASLSWTSRTHIIFDMNASLNKRIGPIISLIYVLIVFNFSLFSSSYRSHLAIILPLSCHCLRCLIVLHVHCSLSSSCHSLIMLMLSSSSSCLRHLIFFNLSLFLRCFQQFT